MYCFCQGDPKRDGNKRHIWYNYTNTPNSPNNWEQKELQTLDGIYPTLHSSPTAAVFGDRLYCLWNNGYGNINCSRSYCSVFPIPDTRLKASPAAVTFSNKLYCFHRGDGDNNLWFNCYDGTEWQGDLKISGCRTNITPAVVVWNNTLYCFHCAASDSTIWYVCSKTPNRLNSWQTKQINSGGAITTNRAGLSVVVFDGKLHCFYGRQDTASGPCFIYHSFTAGPRDENSWQERQIKGKLVNDDSAASLSAKTHPSAVVFNDQIFCFYHSSNSNEIYYSYTNSPYTSDNWTEEKLDVKSGTPLLKADTNPFCIVKNNTLYCFCQGEGSPGNIWYSYTTDGRFWQQYELQTLDGNHPTLHSSPTAAVFGDRLYCLWNNGGHINYSHDLNPKKDPTLHLLNRTAQQPYIYYYRAADFAYRDDKKDNNKKGTYKALRWRPWEKVSLSIPSPYAAPVQAFGKLFIFWIDVQHAQAERHPAKSGNDNPGQVKEHRFQASIYYTFYTLDNTWVAPQSLAKNIELPESVKTQEEAFKVQYQHINVAFQVEQQLISVGYYGGKSNFYTTLDSNLNSIKVPQPQNYNKATLPRPTTDYFTSLPETTVNYPVADNYATWENGVSWAVLDTGKSSYLSIPIYDLKLPDNPHQYYYIRLNSTTVHTLSQKLLGPKGIDVLFTIDAQLTQEDSFTALGPSEKVAKPYPSESLDFAGANGLYYRELFFHTPFLVANRFNMDRKFPDAQTWYHYIFNPTIDVDQPDTDQEATKQDHYWRYLNLRSSHNATLKCELGKTPSEELKRELTDTGQLDEYHEDPFDPHAIAQLRPIAYQKTVVMHYIDNLLDWGDQLFIQNTRETLVEATMLYIIAYDLLGKKPDNLGACTLPSVKTLGEVRAKNLIPEFILNLEQSVAAQYYLLLSKDAPNNYIAGSYFGIPENDQFIAYWDRVQKRLYNIRHQLTIDGKPNYLPLFQPPINPNVLIKAVASEAGVSQALAALTAPIPYYRFSVILEKAKAATNTVIQLGASLLSALEKKDAEYLARLQNTQEQVLLDMNLIMKKDQLEAAQKNVKALEKGLAGAQVRFSHYSELLAGNVAGLPIGAFTGLPINTTEALQFGLETEAIALQGTASAIQGASAAAYLIPTVFGFADGDFNPGDAANQVATVLQTDAGVLQTSASMAATIAQYQRRAEDWTLQKNIADEDRQQIQQQIAAAKVQVHIAQQDIDTLQKNIKQVQEKADFLKTKFTTEERYLWMIGQFSTLYFQMYQMAHQLSLAAEKAWQFERTNPTQTFIQTTYWDSLNKGLMAGEGLMLGLCHMEKAYLDQDERRLEITRIISLKEEPTIQEKTEGEDKDIISKLRKDGTVNFQIQEKLLTPFSDQKPQYYALQIKAISLSIPAVLGPYQNIEYATLTQLSHSIRYNPDTSLTTSGRANQQIAISKGIDESGLFQLSFQDARYLPFEGTGAISHWQLDIPKNGSSANQQLLKSLTDIVITLRYTALSGK